MVMAHQRVVKFLTEYQPSVVVLLGPESVGKMTTLEEVVGDEDEVFRVHEMNAETAREIVEWCESAPMSGHKYVVGRLDNASKEAVGTLLKLFEEPPKGVSLYWTCSSSISPVLLSRCFVFHLRRLYPHEVESVLTKQVGSKEAQNVAWMADGQIREALKIPDYGNVKSHVLTMLKAVTQGEEDLFSSAMVRVDGDVIEMLKRWSIEVATRRWRLFNEGDTYGISPQNAARLYGTLTSSRARPKVLARALPSFLGG